MADRECNAVTVGGMANIEVQYPGGSCHSSSGSPSVKTKSGSDPHKNNT